MQNSEQGGSGARDISKASVPSSSSFLSPMQKGEIETEFVSTSIHTPPLPGSEETDVRASDIGTNRAWALLQMQPLSTWSSLWHASLSELLCEERGDPQRRALCVCVGGVDRRGRDLHPPCSALSALGTS